MTRFIDRIGPYSFGPGGSMTTSDDQTDSLTVDDIYNWSSTLPSGGDMYFDNFLPDGFSLTSADAARVKENPKAFKWADKIGNDKRGGTKLSESVAKIKSQLDAGTHELVTSADGQTYYTRKKLNTEGGGSPILLTTGQRYATYSGDNEGGVGGGLSQEMIDTALNQKIYAGTAYNDEEIKRSVADTEAWLRSMMAVDSDLQEIRDKYGKLVRDQNGDPVYSQDIIARGWGPNKTILTYYIHFIPSYDGKDPQIEIRTVDATGEYDGIQWTNGQFNHHAAPGREPGDEEFMQGAYGTTAPNFGSHLNNLVFVNKRPVPHAYGGRQRNLYSRGGQMKTRVPKYLRDEYGRKLVRVPGWGDDDTDVYF